MNKSRFHIDQAKLTGDIRSHIKDFMLGRKMSAKEFAMVCSITEKGVQRLLNPEYPYLPSLATLCLLAEGMETTLSDLLINY